MRLYELEQQPRGRTEIFLDMDGVLADFFSEYAKLAGVPADERGRHDYHQIPPNLREPVIQRMVGTDFFYRLPKFDSADRLVAMAVKVFGSYNICSSPLRGDHENSRAMKTAWIKKNLNPQPEKIIITPQKGKYAVQPDGTPNILVDDRNTVLTEWEQAGGIGIKYQADENGLDTVARGLRRAFEILKGKREHTPQNIQSRDYGKMIAGPGDKQVNEFAPEGFEQYKLYTGDGVTRHFVGKYTSIDDAREEVEFLWSADPETRLVVWFVTDLNDIVRWYYDPQELADQPRTQFRGAGGLNESTFTKHEEQIRHFVEWCKKKLNITKPLPHMRFQDSKEGPDQHRTGYYDDDTNTMWVYTGNRNLIDIMRTVCHELVHRKQHEHKKAKPGESYPFAPIEQEADAVAGGMIKLYAREYPGSIE